MLRFSAPYGEVTPESRKARSEAPTGYIDRTPMWSRDEITLWPTDRAAWKAQQHRTV
ncbi:hypothetical protein GCM10023317_21700 [Actinopolymorpha pittospori]